MTSTCIYIYIIYIYLNDCALGDDSKLCVGWRLRVLLDTDDREAEGCLQLRQGVHKSHITDMHARVKTVYQVTFDLTSGCVTWAFLNRRA